MDLFVRDLSELESMTLRQRIDQLPFLWGEAGGRNYFAEFAFPVDSVVEGLQYLGDVTSGVKDRMILYPIDQTEAASFTLSYQLCSPESNKWTFNLNELTMKFSQLMLQIKNGAS